ncbi:hypothetical protein [Candidatus Poriferisocius sp.]|uniref:hypothetical protein n=1 Tax=Candidatus Poriferisocius sp. TaxID=3101276 RepID=UPI003B0257C0
MTSDDFNAPFLDRLGAHLQRAAATGMPKRRNPSFAIALVALLAIGLLSAVFFTRQSPAEAIAVTVVGQNVRVEVLSPIADPSLPIRKLRAAGVTATVTEVPVPDGLIGRITAVSTASGNEDVRYDGPNVVLFTVAVGSEVLIEIGREATGDEVFGATESDPACGRWRNKPVSEVMNDIEATIDLIRWQLYDGTRVTEIKNPPQQSLVQDVLPINHRTSIVIVSLTPDALPESPPCQPKP